MIREKIRQAVSILNELDLDLWLIFGRESHSITEPCSEMVIGAGYVWPSVFIITRQGRSIAIVGSLDAAEFNKQGNYENVIAYKTGIRESLLKVLEELNPATMAINYSTDDVMADGLTHGLYLLLTSYLAGTPFADRLVKSEQLVAALRGRKSPEELRRIRRAIEETEKIFQQVRGFIHPGHSEKEIAAFMLEQVKAKGYETAWDPGQCPSVFTGVPTGGEAHTGPTDRRVEPGHVLNMDFGLKIEGFCADLQRTFYICRKGEKRTPPEVEKGFRTIIEAIAMAAEKVRPGVEGWVVDDVARQHLLAQGYEEFPHGLGHQVGRSAHDGAGLLCPRWERYGKLPYLKVEEGQVYTLEPRLTIAEHGVATVEEMIVVAPGGGQFLSSFQKEIWLIC